MVIEILGAIAADAAGDSMHKNMEKKKLEFSGMTNFTGALSD